MKTAFYVDRRASLIRSSTADRGDGQCKRAARQLADPQLSSDPRGHALCDSRSLSWPWRTRALDGDADEDGARGETAQDTEFELALTERPVRRTEARSERPKERQPRKAIAAVLSVFENMWRKSRDPKGMELVVVDSSAVAPLEKCSHCSARLVDISRQEFRFALKPCVAHKPASGGVRLGVELLGRRMSCRAEATADGAFEAVLEIDYRTQRLVGTEVFVEHDGRSVAATFPPADPFVSLQVDTREAASELVRRRRSRKHGFAAQVVASYQAYLYGVESARLEVMAFSLCSVGWRAVQRERALEPGSDEWIVARVDELIVALRAEPGEYARWMPSLCTMTSQLALSRGDVETALRYADFVLAEEDLVERCPISAYNVVLNLGLATFCRSSRDPQDQLDFAMVWEPLFKRIVAAMDIRFGTMYEFKVIYDVLFMVTRMTLIRRNQTDARLKPVSCDEFVEKVFRVDLSKVQKRRLRESLGIDEAEVAVPAVPT